MSVYSFQSEVCRVDGAMNPHGIPVPDAVSGPLREAGVSRLIVRLNGYEMRRALQGSREYGSHLVVGLSLLKAAGVAEGDSVAVEIEPDPEPDCVDVCDELLIALDQDPEAKKRWVSFTPGKQRSIELYVSGAKREETRIKRAVNIVEKIRTRTLHGD